VAVQYSDKIVRENRENVKKKTQMKERRVSVSADTEIIEGKLLNGRHSIASVKAWTDTPEL